MEVLKGGIGVPGACFCPRDAGEARKLAKLRMKTLAQCAADPAAAGTVTLSVIPTQKKNISGQI